MRSQSRLLLVQSMQPRQAASSMGRGSVLLGTLLAVHYAAFPAPAQQLLAPPPEPRMARDLPMQSVLFAAEEVATGPRTTA